MQQYLLGRLPEEAEAELERRYLADDALFEELLAIEDDLRDAYVRGELPIRWIMKHFSNGSWPFLNKGRSRTLHTRCVAASSKRARRLVRRVKGSPGGNHCSRMLEHGLEQFWSPL